MILEEILNIAVTSTCRRWTTPGNNAEEPEAENLNAEQEQENDADEEHEHAAGDIRGLLFLRGRAILRFVDKIPEYPNITLLPVSFIVGVFSWLLLWLYYETTDKCFSLSRFGRSIPHEVHRWQLVGGSIQAILVNLWFVASMQLLLREQLTQEPKLKLILVGLASASFQTIVTAFLIVFDVHNYRSCNEVFIVGLLYSNYLVATAINNQGNTPRVKFLFLRIASHFLIMFVVAIFHQVLVIPSFNREDVLSRKVAIAFISPLLGYLAISISQYLILASSNPWLAKDNRNQMYVLVYFNQLLPLALFRVMQADFDWGWFLGMSVIYGFATGFSNATRELRKKIWEALCEKLLRPNHRPKALFKGRLFEGLHTDLQIQHILFNYALIILSQAYITMCRNSTFDIPLVDEIGRMFGRVAAALGIEFILNIFFAWLGDLLGHPRKKLKEVWSKCYINHIWASMLVIIMTICYFSQVVFSVLHVPMSGYLPGYRIRNCTEPFTY